MNPRIFAFLSCGQAHISSQPKRRQFHSSHGFRETAWASSNLPVILLGKLLLSELSARPCGKASQEVPWNLKRRRSPARIAPFTIQSRAYEMTVMAQPSLRHKLRMPSCFALLSQAFGCLSAMTTSLDRGLQENRRNRPYSACEGFPPHLGQPELIEATTGLNSALPP